MLKKLMMFAGLLGGSVLFSGQALAAADWGRVRLTAGLMFFGHAEQNHHRYVQECLRYGFP